VSTYAKYPVTGGGSAGDVVGPGSATDNAVARYDGTTGKLIQNSVVIVDDAGNTSGIGTLNASGTATVGNIIDSGLTASQLVVTDVSKQLASVARGNLTDVGTDGIVITGGAGAVVGAGTTIAQQVSDATHNGYLSSTDWSTFNGKQASGNYITALTADVTAAGPGSVAATVAKIQGTTVSGTTGSTNVVFSSAPTLSNPVVGTQSQGDSSTKAASTAYVDTAVANAVAGVNPAVSVKAATTQASDTSGLAYNNGVSGVGATLTGSINTAITFDGVTFTAVGQRALVKNDTQSPSGAFNGVYSVTQVQTVGLPPILTRALDYNAPSDINNTGAIPVVSGTLNASTSWLLTSSVTTVGTDALTYTKFSINPTTILTNTLTSAHVFVGNSSNVATDVAMSGDASMANTGAITVAKVNGVAYGASPSTNTIPVVTGSNTITYETAPVAAGGTGQTSYTDGQLLIGNSSGSTLTKSTLTAGSGITVTNGNGSITIAASGGAGVTVTAWASYTPTFVGAGTLGTTALFWRRVGDTIEITGNFTTGTATGVGATLTIPNSLVGDNSGKIPTQRVCGRAYLNDATSNRIKNICFICTANVNTISISNEEYSSSLAPVTGQLGNSVFFSGSLYSIDCIKIPIDGWTTSN
jgi:hypothetical protein